jgi:hypothetical protein
MPDETNVGDAQHALITVVALGVFHIVDPFDHQLARTQTQIPSTITIDVSKLQKDSLSVQVEANVAILPDRIKLGFLRLTHGAPTKQIQLSSEAETCQLRCVAIETTTYPPYRAMRVRH